MKMTSSRSIFATALSVCGLCAPCALAGTVFTGLGHLPNDSIGSSAYAISGDGSTIVGRSGLEAFRWTSASGMQNLGTTTGVYDESSAFGVNLDGSMVVGTRSYAEVGNPNTVYHGFRWSDSAGVAAFGGGASGVTISDVYDSSDDGSAIIGKAHFAGTNGEHAFRWTETGGFENLGTLATSSFTDSKARAISADGSVVVGQDQLSQAFRWTSDGGMEWIHDGDSSITSSTADDISADGSVIVGTAMTEFGNVPYRWSSESGTELLDTNPGITGWFGVSADGSSITGTSTSLGPFLWTVEDGIRSLSDVLTDDYGIDLGGWELSFVRGMSDDGLSIVGRGINPSGDMEAFYVRIPSPGSATLLVMTCGLAARRRR